MGWSASWVAVHGSSKSEILQMLQLEETGEEVEPGSRVGEFSYHELPGGDWAVVFCEYFGGLGHEEVLKLSHLGLTVGCQFEDKVEMASSAVAARAGEEVWRLYHDNTKSPFRLDVTGNPPPEFAQIRDIAMAAQEEEEKQKRPSVDFLHDVPMVVAASVCGYRHEDYLPAFAALRSTRLEPDRPRRPSLWDRLFRR